jgi:hypothetical protein
VPECHTCGSPTADNANLCRTHTRELSHLLGQIPDRVETVQREHLDAFERPTYRDLRDRHGHPIPYAPSRDPIHAEKPIPGIATDLQTSITRQDKLGVTSDTRATGEKPLNWNDRASIIAVELNATINAWALATSKHDEDSRDPLAGYHHSDTAEVADWLRRNLTTLAQLQDAGEAYDEIRNSVGRALGAIDRPKNRTSFLVGPCPEKLGDIQIEPCPGEVWAFIPTSESDPALMRCQYEQCGAAWNTTQWLRASRRILARREELERKEGRRWPFPGAA